MKTIFIIIFYFACLNSGTSQIDTLKLKTEIDTLSNDLAIAAYLTNIFKEDQYFRGERTSVTSDLARLISISYFFNKHEYPLIEQIGKASIAPRLIWIHNKYLEPGRIAFPLVLKAFHSGQISEKTLRSYYLKGPYQNQFDDTGNMELTLDYLFKTLNLNTSDHISIKELIIKIDEIKKLNSLHKKEILMWHASEKSKWITQNGERLFITYKTDPVEIFTLENCKIYFQKIFLDHSYEPKELIKIDENKYRFKDQKTDKYFEISESGNLYYRNKDEIFDEYPLKE